MSTKTKAVIAVFAVVIILLVGFVVYWELNHGNRTLIEVKNRFDRAIISLPNGEVVEGKISSWQDYSDCDVVQITMGGKTYITSYSNVCLIDD